jgi:hypothetical protein
MKDRKPSASELGTLAIEGRCPNFRCGIKPIEVSSRPATIPPLTHCPDCGIWHGGDECYVCKSGAVTNVLNVNKIKL